MSVCLSTEAGIKWPSFRRWHLQMHFANDEWKPLYFSVSNPIFDHGVGEISDLGQSEALIFVTWRVIVMQPMTSSPWRPGHSWLHINKKMNAWNIIRKYMYAAGRGWQKVNCEEKCYSVGKMTLLINLVFGGNAWSIYYHVLMYGTWISFEKFHY